MKKTYLLMFALMLTMLGISDAMAQKIYRAERAASPLSEVNVSASYDVIRVDFGVTTNLKDLVKASPSNTLVFDNSTVSVDIDGEPIEVLSVEGYEDGNLYIFIEDDYYGDAEMKVAFRNPEDDAHRLVFTSGNWEGEAVPEFSGIVASFDQDLGNAGYVSYLYAPPALLEISPEAGSFNLPGDLNEFTVTFNQPVKIGSVFAMLDEEFLIVSGEYEDVFSDGEAYTKIIKLTRSLDEELSGSKELIIYSAEGKAGSDFGLQDPIVVKYSFGPVVLDGDDQPAVIYESNFTSEGENALGAGWKVNSDSEGLQDANSGYGCRLVHGKSGFAADVLYLAQRSAAAGIALYGTVDDYKLTLEGGKTYHLTLKSAQWDAYPASGSNRSLRAQVLTEEAVDAEDGTVIDETGILAEEFKAVDGRINEDKEFTSFDIEFTPEADGNFVIRLVVGNLEGNPAGWSDGNAIADVKVEYVPDVLGVVENKQLAEALQSAKDAYNELTMEEYEGRYEGEDLIALENLIAEVEADMAGYTAPSVFVAKAEELNAAVKAITDYAALCNEYDQLIQEAFDLYVAKKDTKFNRTEYFTNLAYIVNRYCTLDTETYFDESIGEDVTALVLKDFVKYYTTAELNRARAELSETITLASKWLTEGESYNYAGGLVTSGYAALHDRLRRGIELLKELGVADDDPLIVAADDELGDNDAIAEAIIERAKAEIYAKFANGEEEGYDLTAFVKNPNVYCPAYSIETPGWTSVQGYCYGWSSWDVSRNHTENSPYPEDCHIYAGWHPNPSAAVEQTITNLPVGVYTIKIKCNSNGEVTDGTYGYLKLSNTPVVEYGEWIDPDYHYAYYAQEDDCVFEDVVITDGILTIGRSYGTTSQAFFDGVEIYLTAPFEGFDYEDLLNGNENTEEHNSLYIADGLRFSTTKTNMLPISLQNEDDIVGFQLDVVLPQGMTVALDDEEDYIVTSENTRAKEHSLSCNVLGDGTIRIVGTSLSNKKIASGDGLLLNMGINIASWLENGDYAIQLKNVKFTNADKKTVLCSDKVFYVTVGGKLGDVNHDDAVDVTDAVLIIDHILAKNPANFDASLADVNGDGDIDVTDVVFVIDAILGKVTLSRGAEPIDRSAYTAFQMDLTIPAGYVLESVSLTDIAKDSHSLVYTMLPDGRCRVVVCSMNNEALPGAWDEVIRLNLRGQGDAQVNIDRAVFVTIDGERHELMMNPTSIAELSTLNSQISTRYDLQGRKVEKNAKGILIENGKKIVIK